MKPLILVVEDNRTLRTLLVSGLSGYGYEVREADSLEQAKEYLLKERLPNAILLDLQLPDGHGSELIRFVRNDLYRNEIGIIVTTGMNVDVAPLLAIGANAVLNKPVDFATLFDQFQALKLWGQDAAMPHQNKLIAR
jgi:CheY-like chemotaxis protein